MTLIETHRSFVNTWECDENAHMNVQFYWKRFAEATSVFSVLTNCGPCQAKSRHVRYHRELAAGCSTLVQSAIVETGEYNGALFHQLIDASTGQVAATSLEVPGPSGNNLPVISTAAINMALPRSVRGGDLAPATEISLKDLIRQGRAVISHRGVIQPMECDSTGKLLEQFHISRFSDAAPHIWDLMQLDSQYLLENQLGRVAVEMKLTRHGTVTAGTLFHVVSTIEAIREKTFTLCHHVFDTATGTALFSGEVTGVVMSLVTRRVVTIPDRVSMSC